MGVDFLGRCEVGYFWQKCFVLKDEICWYVIGFQDFLVMVDVMKEGVKCMDMLVDVC